ncbi:MAG: WD40/YVTN/BNR-like repeat-containing protein, partial [Sphingomonadales bacterium]
MRHFKLSTALVVASLLFGFQAFSQDKTKEPTAGQVFAGLKFRNIGPALTSGRISDIAVSKSDVNTFFVATASGGLWKTKNNGISWDPVFDSEASFSLGVVEIDPNNSEVVWAGTGENNSQRSVAFGDGVYKSNDGGKSWKNMGLATSEHIGQIVIDPRNSDTVFVAAQGPLWNSGGERGVYKTADGGNTWTRVLNIDEHTGANELLMSAENPDVMIASSYQRQRHLWTMIDGGPGGGIHRSNDGGNTWSKITNGLPGGDLGKIGLAQSASHPNIIYAVIEGTKKTKGLYRSINFGVSWEKRSSKTSGGPMYYNELTVDPNDPNKVYLVDTYLSRSDDGGKTFKNVPIKHKHVDSHVLWVNPNDSTHIREGNDGGLYESFDGGDNWRHYQNMSLTQFYRVETDN